MVLWGKLFQLLYFCVATKSKIMKRVILALLCMAVSAVFAAENKSKLVVGITISNFYPEWLTIYKNDLSDDGLRRLVVRGKEMMADYNYLYSQTGVDQATIYSGLLPCEHGIVAHDWYDRLRERRQNNVESKDCSLVGEEGTGLSPDYLQAMTLGCAMKMHNAFSRVFSVAMNGEEAVLSGGSCANLALWFGEKTGRWVTSSYYVDSLPGWVKEYNDTLKTDFYIRRGWMSLSDEEDNASMTKWKSRVGIASGFYYDLMQAKRKYGTYGILKGTPYANELVANMAKEIVRREALGKDNDPDLLTVGFSCLDYMNRELDVNSKEFQDVVMRLDRDVAGLLTELDERVGVGNYTVFLTFTESRELLPVELEKMRIASGYFSIFKAVALTKSFLSLLYGEGEWILDYDATQIYLNRALIEEKKISLSEIQDKVAGFLVEFEGISHVRTAYSLTHNASARGSGDLFQHAFSQKRSGDILYSLQTSWLPELKDREDYYARYSKRSQVPVYFYGAGLPAHLGGNCRMTDLLPLLCRILGVSVPYPVAQ